MNRVILTSQFIIKIMIIITTKGSRSFMISTPLYNYRLNTSWTWWNNGSDLRSRGVLGNTGVTTVS